MQVAAHFVWAWRHNICLQCVSAFPCQVTPAAGNCRVSCTRVCTTTTSMCDWVSVGPTVCLSGVLPGLLQMHPCIVV